MRLHQLGVKHGRLVPSCDLFGLFYSVESSLEQPIFHSSMSQCTKRITSRRAWIDVSWKSHHCSPSHLWVQLQQNFSHALLFNTSQMFIWMYGNAKDALLRHVESLPRKVDAYYTIYFKKKLSFIMPNDSCMLKTI